MVDGFTMTEFFGFITLGISFGAGFFVPMAVGMTIIKAVKQS